MNTIDELGRVLIPKKARDPLGWEKGNALAMVMCFCKLFKPIHGTFILQCQEVRKR